MSRRYYIISATEHYYTKTQTKSTLAGVTFDMTGFMWPQLPAVSIWKNQKLSIGGLDEIAFWNKRRGRRFVNLALKENNPLCQQHLIPSHHTEDKYHSIHVAGWWFPWSFWSCEFSPSHQLITFCINQGVQKFLPQPLPLTFMKLSNVSCMA